MSQRSVALTALAIAAGVIALPTSASATFPGQNGPIAYNAVTFTNKTATGIKGTTVNTILPDVPGTDTRVLSGDAYGFNVSISPNGRRLALGTSTGLFVADIAGEGQKRLVKADDVATVTWSLDGSTVVFARFGTGIWSIPAAGGTPKALLANPNARTLLHEPTFTADGAALLYSRLSFSKNGNITGSELWRANPDGSGTSKVLAGKGQLAVLQQPNASPDGTKLAFVAETKSLPLKSRVYVSNLDGSNPQPVSPLAGKNRAFNTAVWSPDGTRLVVARVSFDLAKGGSLELIDPATSAVTVLKKVKRGMLLGPAWGPVPTA